MNQISKDIPDWASDIYTDPAIALPFGYDVLAEGESDSYEDNQECIQSQLVARYLFKKGCA